VTDDPRKEAMFALGASRIALARANGLLAVELSPGSTVFRLVARRLSPCEGQNPYMILCEETAAHWYPHLVARMTHEQRYVSSLSSPLLHTGHRTVYACLSWDPKGENMVSMTYPFVLEVDHMIKGRSQVALVAGAPGE